MPYLKQPCNTPGCGPCGSGGGGPLIGTPTCASRTGSGNLRGWSKPQNHNSGDWNLRKVKTWAFSSDTDGMFVVGYGTTEALCNAGSYCGTRHHEINATTAEWNVASNALSHDASYDAIQCSVNTGTASLSPADTSATNYVAGCSPSLSTGDFSRVWTTTGCVGPCASGGTPCCGFWDGPYPGTFGYARWDATVFDSVDAALARGSSSAGSLCKTTAGTIGSTTALSTTQIAISGTTSVKVTIPLLLLTVAQAYEIDIVLNRYTAGGGGLVDDVTVKVAFTADATSDTLVYDVPVNTDFDYEFVSATNLVAV